MAQPFKNRQFPDRGDHYIRTNYRLFQYKFLNEFVKNPNDVFFLEYISLEYSAFFQRVNVAAIYAVGFALLLIPTITTIGIIIRGW